MNLLSELIQIESTTSESINKAIEFSHDYLKNHGIRGDIIENNGLKSYVSTIGKGDKTLIFNGHLDVVSGNPEQFSPKEKEGKIIGRGSADMKGGCVAMINAFIELNKEELPCKIMLQLVPDEETGGKNGTGYLVEQGYTGDFVICTEPTNLKISIKTKGIINLFIKISGVSAHGSRPWEGVNAITRAYENLLRIEKLDILNEGSHYYKSSSVNLGKIRGGDILNRVPDLCEMGIDIRYVPHLDPEKIIDEIKKVVDGEVSVGMVEPGVDTQADDPYIEKLKESVSSIIPGEQVELTVAHGGSDGRYFFYKGIPAVELGPKGNFWHGDEEYVEQESIEQLERILVHFARSF